MNDFSDNVKLIKLAALIYYRLMLYVCLWASIDYQKTRTIIILLPNSVYLRSVTRLYQYTVENKSIGNVIRKRLISYLNFTEISISLDKHVFRSLDHYCNTKSKYILLLCDYSKFLAYLFFHISSRNWVEHLKTHLKVSSFKSEA